MLVLESWWHEQTFLLDVCLIVEAQCIWTPFNRFIVPCGDCGHEIKRRLLLERKVMTNLDSIFKSRDITLPTKVHLVRLWFFQWSCMDVRVGLWRKLSTEELMLLSCGVVVLEKTLESPLDTKEIQSVHSKGYQPWVFFGRTHAESETPVLWRPHAKSWLIGKDSDAGRNWGQKQKGMTEDEMAGWHHQIDGCEFEWTPAVGDGQEAWRAIIHGVAKSRIRLSYWIELTVYAGTMHVLYSFVFFFILPILNDFFLLKLNLFKQTIWVFLPSPATCLW